MVRDDTWRASSADMARQQETSSTASSLQCCAFCLTAVTRECCAVHSRPCKFCWSQSNCSIKAQGQGCSSFIRDTYPFLQRRVAAFCTLSYERPPEYLVRGPQRLLKRGLSAALPMSNPGSNPAKGHMETLYKRCGYQVRSPSRLADPPAFSLKAANLLGFLISLSRRPGGKA